MIELNYRLYKKSIKTLKNFILVFYNGRTEGRESG
jgi:hypothetical protein